MASLIVTAARRGFSFLARQKRNYRVSVARSSAQSFLLNLTQQYNSIYTVGLGAGSVELGTVTSIGGAISSLISPPIGWLADRYGVRALQMMGVGLMAGCALIFGLAGNWYAIIAATILGSVAMRLIGTGCSVITADAVHNEDRVTAQNVCVTFASTAGLLSPLLAAFLISRFGGMNVEGIRPLYYIRFVGYLLILVFLGVQLHEVREPAKRTDRRMANFAADFREIFRSPGIPRWLLVATLSSLPGAMMTPFVQLYAHEIKGADEYLLGLMATAMVATRMLVGIPLGRLADKIGRKRMIYLITPLWYLSTLLLVWATGPVMLVIAGALQTFMAISVGATSAMGIEMMPLDKQGRWSGLQGLVVGLVTVPAPILGGWIWDALGPQYILLLPLAIDLLVRVPLLATVPETLGQANP